MKVLQLIADVLLSLLALLVLMAVMPMPVSASAAYPAQPDAYHSQAVNAPSLSINPGRSLSLNDASLKTLPATGMTASDTHRYLDRLTYSDAAGMHSRPLTSLASQHAASDCNAVAGPARCDNQARAGVFQNSETSYLPEPSPWFMLVLGLIGIALLRREP